MILKFSQIDRQPNPIFEGRIKNTVVITGKGATQSNNGFLEHKGQRIEILSNLHREKIHGKTATQVIDIVQGKERIGYIYPDLVAQKKFLFLSFGYEYFVFHFNGTTYSAYEVGLGANEHYICVYRNDETIAIIKKEDKKTNFCDQYIIYALEETELLPMSILTLYFDCIRYPDHGEIMDEYCEDDSFLTTQKELNARYDAAFIKKVEELDEIIN